MGAAYSSLSRTEVLYATSLVLLSAKVKFLRRKPSVLVALEVSKDAKIRNRYNQVPHLTQDTNGKVTNSQ